MQSYGAAGGVPESQDHALSIGGLGAHMRGAKDSERTDRRENSQQRLGISGFQRWCALHAAACACTRHHPRARLQLHRDGAVAHAQVHASLSDRSTLLQAHKRSFGVAFFGRPFLAARLDLDTTARARTHEPNPGARQVYNHQPRTRAQGLGDG